MSRLLERYRTEIAAKLQKELERKNILAVPRLERIVVSMGLGSAIEDRKRLEQAVGHLRQLTGQQPQITRSTKSVSAFRLREGMEIGCRVTLRARRMFEFLDRLISLALPRVRDFRGLNPKSFDGHGNYSLGLKEQLAFPEIDPDSVHYVQGMNITLVTSARDNEEGYLLLKELGMPFRKHTDER